MFSAGAPSSSWFDNLLGRVHKGGKIMAPSSLVRVGGALASIVAGIFVAIGQLINLGGTLEYGTVFGQNIVLISHVAFVFAFVGLYAAQAERSGILGQLGMVLGTIGTTLIAAIVFMELAGVYGVTAAGEALEEMGSLSVYNIVGPLVFLVGIILFGVAVMRAGVFTRWTGWLLIIGAVLGLLGGIAAVQIIFALGAVVAGAGFAWLGWELLSGGGEEAQQPTARVS
jgi:hypothetical protein